MKSNMPATHDEYWISASKTGICRQTFNSQLKKKSVRYNRNMHAVQTCLHLLWLHLIVILFGTASLAQTVKRLCAGFSPLWFETAVHLFPQSQNTCTYTGARDLSCNMQLIPADVSFIRSDVDVLLKIGPFCRVSGHRRLHVFPQTSPQIPFKAGCAIAGHEASGFGTGSLYLLRKRGNVCATLSAGT